MRTDTNRRAARSRAGFTAIELMVVLIVILVLIGLAVPGLVGAMRKGSVNDAANAIMRVSSQARQFARTRPAPKSTPPGVTQAYFGLVIVGDRQPYVALTWGPDCTKDFIYVQKTNWAIGDDRTDYDIYKLRSPLATDLNAKPVSKLLFNRNVIVYVGEKNDPADPSVTPLTADIGWFYQFRTGYPIKPTGGPQPDSRNVNIGVDPEHPIDGTATPPNLNMSAAEKAQAFPMALRHLTLRTSDGRYTSAIAIYQIGLANVQDL